MADVYASRADLEAAIGGTISGAGDRFDLALLVASRWVDYRVGTAVTEANLSAPYTLVVVACPPAWKAATIAAAVRFLKSPDVPFGVAGMDGSGMTAYVRTSMPEVELLLFGHRMAWGMA
jgi:hypothetical protein